MRGKKISKYRDEFVELSRDRLRLYHDRLTKPQTDQFNRMYGSIEEIPYEKMAWAYQKVRRTVDGNKKKKK